MGEIKMNNGNSRVKGRRLKRIIITGALGFTLIGGAVTGIVKGFDALFSESYESKSTSETLDNLGELYSEKGTEFIIDSNWDDSDVMKTIHQMSHQKVEADQKWGAIQITKERLDTLSTIIEENKDYLDHYDVYRDILDRWISGNFDSADNDHNRIWSLQNGTVGKATGTLSPENEKEYVEDVFE